MVAGEEGALMVGMVGVASVVGAVDGAGSAVGRATLRGT